MDLDEFKESLSKKLDTPVFEASDREEMAAVIRSKRRSVLRYFRLFMRIEILIFVWEIIDSIMEISKTDDSWSKGFEGVNILISVVLIVIFLRIIKKIRSPFNRTLSVRENTEKVLLLMKRFYRYYLLLALLYSFSVVIYYIIGTLVRGSDFHAAGKRSLELLQIADPLKRYALFIGNELLFGIILFLLFWLLVWLFYGWRIRRLNKLLSDINY
ncbi:hypothetical protein [Sinomicrobium weinanense]|uniref:Uncharacterized protein n=1 Tax=Sinomicrobium weinanense TaxID=2842200 RepID=A0A926JSU1_9FLAO|nr:hypothetical protein [Sinomicrobium weinanense]MBC9796551.1 hypothetical protein [Sinomicrobium weinanense]MBU3123062.1 hypothetical protein [Sinomicrobium weinanense]